ncbi:MAG: thiosulfate oxidation carrier complex protein SoxZ [Hyphomicrobium sp.]|nr:thiosulfate oxidation carrier complex protein SoxZ [Hyphomicrobium sp.]
MATKPRIKLPDTVKTGDVIEVKTLITHVMETGNRKDSAGKPVPRDILNTFVAKYGQDEVFRAELGPGISANPYISFQMRVPGPGTFEFSWTDDHGVTTVETAALNVV